LSLAPILLVPIPFGKHRGRKLAEVIKDDPHWVVWLAEEGTSSVWRRGAALALGLLDDEEDATEPSDVLAAIALPLVVFQFEEAVALYMNDPHVGPAMDFAKKLLRGLCEDITHKSFDPAEVPL